ncbi:hypothetical protein EAH80_16300 [Mycobacterium hodleri]|uniref:Uncharacterized protein n=1 Tax=Mycolicibacterium hodleri TaxID=49897 RepID=A0A502EB88_9MYCO|nr:hypothetical protein EAH80_16300 [Mycolicibacterium hodleri]
MSSQPPITASTVRSKFSDGCNPAYVVTSLAWHVGSLGGADDTYGWVWPTSRPSKQRNRMVTDVNGFVNETVRNRCDRFDTA